MIPGLPMEVDAVGLRYVNNVQTIPKNNSIGKMKQTFHTQVDSYENRQKVWQQSIAASEYHVKLGESLQGQGLELIKAIQVLQGDSEAAAKLLSQAAAAIEKGVKIQRESQREIVMLRETKPRGR